MSVTKLGGSGPLGKWLRDNCIPTDEFRRVSGLPKAATERLLKGTGKPTLAMALRINWATGGEVPPEAWLDDPVTFEEYRWLADRGTETPEMKPVYSEGWMKKIKRLGNDVPIRQYDEFAGAFSDTPDDRGSK